MLTCQINSVLFTQVAYYMYSMIGLASSIMQQSVLYMQLCITNQFTDSIKLNNLRNLLL